MVVSLWRGWQYNRQDFGYMYVTDEMQWLYQAKSQRRVLQVSNLSCIPHNLKSIRYVSERKRSGGEQGGAGRVESRGGLNGWGPWGEGARRGGRDTGLGEGRRERGGDEGWREEELESGMNWPKGVCSMDEVHGTGRDRRAEGLEGLGKESWAS
jgi:hypothetical protein